MIHSEGFLSVVDDAKKRIKEITVEETRAKQERHEDFVLIDVREDREWDQGHAAGAIHLGGASLNEISKWRFRTKRRRSSCTAEAASAPLWPPTRCNGWDTRGRRRWPAESGPGEISASQSQKASAGSAYSLRSCE